MKQRTWNPAQLDAPLRWRKPYMVTLDGDLFNRGMSDEQIAAVFGVMAACPRSIYRVWTAHPKRAREWFEWAASRPWWVQDQVILGYRHPWSVLSMALEKLLPAAKDVGLNASKWYEENGHTGPAPWPLPNVWLGIVAHEQAELDERAPDILTCPAALHWLRLVLHGRADLRRWLGKRNLIVNSIGTCLDCAYYGPGPWHDCPRRFGHIDVSGAIGKDAPPCDVEWIRDVIRQGRDAGVPVYVRALGTRARMDTFERITRARNGDRPSEWLEDLRAREWPEGVEVDG